MVYLSQWKTRMTTEAAILAENNKENTMAYSLIFYDNIYDILYFCMRVA